MNIKAGSPLELDLLKQPTTDCSPSYSWLWNVTITKEGIDEQLSEFTKAGIRSVNIIPFPKDFHPDKFGCYLDPEYLSEEFLELMSYAIHRMVELGIKPWIYDEAGWPSGAAGGRTARENPNTVANHLRKNDITLKAGEKYTPCDGHLALYSGKNRLSDNFVADADCTLTEYFTAKSDALDYFIDFTDETAIDTFLGNTYEQYKKIAGELFGDTIPLFFNDEPGIRSSLLPKGVFEGFKAEFGYDLLDFLHAISDSDLADTEEEIRARIDFGTYVNRLYLKNTFDKISKWCESNGIAYSGHLMADNYPHANICGSFSILNTLKRMHIPGIDVIWEQIRLPYGGRRPVDAEETEKMPFFPILARSAARQMGRNIALSESLSIYGDGVSPDEIRYVVNYQIVRGINLFCYYGLPYGRSRCAAIMMRPGFCPEKPGFYQLKHLNEYVERLSYLGRLGYAEGDTALYHPTTDYYASTEICDNAIKSFGDAGKALEAKNIAFDIIDDTAILEAEITSEGLKIGDAIYRHIVVPENKYIPEAVRKKIKPYLGEGTPTYEFKNKDLRVLTRKLDTGRLWFIFNEGIEPADEMLNIANGHRVYRIDATNGNIYDARECRIKLTSGDIAVFLVTDEEYPVAQDTPTEQLEITGFNAISYKQFVYEYEGISNVYGKGAPDFSKVFSGEVTYEAEYVLPCDPNPNDVWQIRLDGFGVWATVQIGDTVKTLGLTPMRAELDAASLSGKGKILLTVANTAADELVAKRDVIFSHPISEIAPMYQNKALSFEEHAQKFRFGRVFLEKLN